MSENIKRRLEKVEQTVDIHKESATAIFLDCLCEYGYETVATYLQEAQSPNLRNKPFSFLMHIADDIGEELAFEQYRGLVPDEVIRQAYNYRRNWSGCSDEVRRLAGVIDAEGNVMPSYVLLGNGCIVERDASKLD